MLLLGGGRVAESGPELIETESTERVGPGSHISQTLPSFWALINKRFFERNKLVEVIGIDDCKSVFLSILFYLK